MVMVMKNILELIISLMIIHFGMNPTNGGSPPSDRKFIENKIFIFFLLFIVLIICWMEKELFILNIIVIFSVMMV